MVFQKHGKASADATFFMIHDIDFKCFADDPNPVTIQSILYVIKLLIITAITNYNFRHT